MKTTKEQRKAYYEWYTIQSSIDALRICHVLDDLDEAEKRIEYLESGFIHTCHDKCKNRDCVQVRRIELLEKAIKKVDETLRVPAAEYVPAISDAFTVIDEALAKSRGMGKLK